MKFVRMLRLLGFLFALAAFTAQSQDLSTLRDQGQVQNRAELEKIVAREPPSSMTYIQMEAFYYSQWSAALRLGDAQIAERVLRRWLKDAPDAMNARWYLWNQLIQGERWVEGLQLGESLLKSGPKTHRDKVRVAIELANNYREAGNLARSTQLLADAEKTIASNFHGEPYRSADAFFVQFAKRNFFDAQCAMSLSLQKIATAIEQCQLAEDQSREMVASMAWVEEHFRFIAPAMHVISIATLSQMHMAAGRRFDADATRLRAITLAKTYGLGRAVYFRFFDINAEANIAQHDFQAAGQVALEGLREVAAAHEAPTNRWSMRLKGHLLRSLVGQARWSEAQAAFDALDRDAGADALMQKRALNLSERAATAIMTGQPQRVVAPLLSALQANEADFGPDHLITGFTRGLYGMALAASPEVGEQGKALPELARAVASITAPSPLARTTATLACAASIGA